MFIQPPPSQENRAFDKSSPVQSDGEETRGATTQFGGSAKLKRNAGPEWGRGRGPPTCGFPEGGG
ncbi:hypothetical protein CSC81_18135, partial [Tenacibaculum discolor]